MKKGKSGKSLSGFDGACQAGSHLVKLIGMRFSGHVRSINQIGPDTPA